MKLTLKALRITEGLDQKQTAKLLGVARSTIEAYESGRFKPSLTVGLRISHLLGVNLNDIVFAPRSKKPNLAPMKGESDHAE